LQFPLEAGLLDAEAKRFGVALASTESALARALISYLGLHKPEKHALRLAKAARIVEEINVMVATGEVRRNGVSRPATAAMWVQAIESMLDNRGKLRLPLSGHGYVLEIVFGLADQADAVAERQREERARVGAPLQQASAKAAPASEDRLANELAFLRQMRDYGQLDAAEFERRAAEARTKFGGGS
jgi:hypothetical protein